MFTCVIVSLISCRAGSSTSIPSREKRQTLNPTETLHTSPCSAFCYWHCSLWRQRTGNPAAAAPATRVSVRRCRPRAAHPGRCWTRADAASSARLELESRAGDAEPQPSAARPDSSASRATKTRRVNQGSACARATIPCAALMAWTITAAVSWKQRVWKQWRRKNKRLRFRTRANALKVRCLKHNKTLSAFISISLNNAYQWCIWGYNWIVSCH